MEKDDEKEEVALQLRTKYRAVKFLQYLLKGVTPTFTPHLIIHRYIVQFVWVTIFIRRFLWTAVQCYKLVQY